MATDLQHRQWREDLTSNLQKTLEESHPHNKLENKPFLVGCHMIAAGLFVIAEAMREQTQHARQSDELIQAQESELHELRRRLDDYSNTEVEQHPGAIPVVTAPAAQEHDAGWPPQ